MPEETMFRSVEGDNFCLLLPSAINEEEEEVGEDLGDISLEEEPCSEYGLWKVEGEKKPNWLRLALILPSNTTTLLESHFRMLWF